MNVKSLLKKSVLILACAVLVYTLIMLAVTLIPNHAVEKNVNLSLQILEDEGSYPKYFFESDAARLDNFTDRLMVSSALTDQSKSLTESAMVIHSRVQYWQGYLVFLKPLLLFFELHQIRYLIYTLYFLLFSYSIVLISRKSSLSAVIAYTAAMIASNILFTSVSLQFIGVYLIMFVAIIAYLRLENTLLKSKENLFLFFLFIGSFTCFIDFLTVPLITLGIPLCILLTEKFRQASAAWRENCLITFGSSTFWGTGYALTFLTKWSVASLLLQRNAFTEALDQLFFRVNGDEEMVVDRVTVLQTNVMNILGFDRFSWIEMGFAAALIVIFGVLVFLIKPRLYSSDHPSSANHACTNAFIALISLYPYLWYMVFANHSQIHFWFTYRSQMITVFGLTYLFLSTISRGKKFKQKPFLPQ